MPPRINNAVPLEMSLFDCGDVSLVPVGSVVGVAAGGGDAVGVSVTAGLGDGVGF